jgi:hypothetical protein
MKLAVEGTGSVLLCLLPAEVDKLLASIGLSSGAERNNVSDGVERKLLI